MWKRSAICGILITFAVKNHIIKGMKRILLPFALLLAALCVCTSCLKSDKDSEVTYYNDTAITGFTLGTVNRYLHTTSKSGADSVYKATYAGSAYKFYIDQQKGEIFNPDSLPYGTDAAHLLCTITTKNSGTVIIKDNDSDTQKYFNSNDSLDLSKPCTLRVISNDGTATRDYLLWVNVHKETTDKIVWSEGDVVGETSAVLKDFKTMRLLDARDHMVLLGSNGQDTKLITYWAGTGWKVYNEQLDAEAVENVVAMGNDVYFLSYDRLWCHKADGSTTAVEASTVPRRLLAATDNKLYGVGADGSMAVSTDEGRTWTAEEMDSDSNLLPTEDVTSAFWTLRTNDDVQQLVMVGNRSEQADATGATAQVWSKTIDPDEQTRWNYITPESAIYPLPRMHGVNIVRYGDALVALGGPYFSGGSTTSNTITMYVSRDGGINWQSDSRFFLPTSLTEGVFGMTIDTGNRIWIVNATTGKMYSGRLGSLDLY